MIMKDEPPSPKPKPEGWIWRLGSMDDLLSDDIKKWSEESMIPIISICMFG